MRPLLLPPLQCAVAAVALILLVPGRPDASEAVEHRYFTIAVEDAVTGAPVGCARIETVHKIIYTSDRNGVVAFYEPGLMGEEVYFHVRREGYLGPAAGFGFRGAILEPEEGGRAVIALEPVGEPGSCEADDSQTRRAQGPVPPGEELLAIEVVDAESGRGIPLAELRSSDRAEFSDFSDSSGRVAFFDPNRAQERLSFDVRSHGYRPAALTVEPGARRARVALERRNVAERLYRVTGAGSYRASVLLGDRPPTREPLLNALVVGQDSARSAVYRGRVFWVWGDTHRLGYPLGNFRAAAATSELPGAGGLDPELGVDLEYFVEEPGGFARRMAPRDTVPKPPELEGGWAVWLGGLAVVPDEGGEERLLARYVIVQGFVVREEGLVRFDDEAGVFEKVLVFGEEDRLQPGGDPFGWRHAGEEYLYFHNGMRVRASEAALLDSSGYESWTALAQGSGAELERDAAGRLVYAWKAATPLLDDELADELDVAAGTDELLFGHLREPDSAVRVLPHAGGSTAWNPHRGRFVRMVPELFGESSLLGELWYAEGDTPMGPWVYARKIVTHDAYSFYAPRHHPFFDRDGGRVIYFEGTYSNFFTDSTPTPRHDYNQFMYRLDLEDERLALPVPVYDLEREGLPGDLVTKRELRPGMTPPAPAFFAMDRPAPGLVPVHWRGAACARRRLRAGGRSEGEPLFYALSGRGELPPDAVPLYEFVERATGARAYGVETELEAPDFLRSPEPLAWVWRSPLSVALPVADYLPDLIADAGEDQCIPHWLPGRGAALVLDGSRSRYLDGDIASFEWRWGRRGRGSTSARAAEGIAPEVFLRPGHHVIELTVTNANGDLARDSVVVEVGRPRACGLGYEVALALLPALHRRVRARRC